MKNMMKNSTRKQASLVLTSTLVAASVIPSFGNVVEMPVEEIKNTSEIVLNENIKMARTTSGGINEDPGKTPEKGKIYNYDFTSSASEVVVPPTYNQDNRIQTLFSPDGLVKMNGEGKMYYHDGTHGLAVFNDNSFEIKVAGDADITFKLCVHSKGGKINGDIVGTNGELSTESVNLQGSADGETVSFSYTGEATTIKFTISGCTGESYLHGINVANEAPSSSIDNVQKAMPQVVDKNGGLSVTPVGHRLILKHENAKASIDDLDEAGYYLFDASSDVMTLEADIEVNSVKSGSNQGIFIGMFGENDTNISTIATLGMRGNNTIRNVFNKTTAPNAPGAGKTNVAYSVGDKVHVLLRKTESGWHTELTQGDIVTEADIKFSETVLLDNINTKVRYGFALSNVTATIRNLTYKDAEGNVLYSQTDCYEAIGKAPEVESIETPVISKDRTTITVNWQGDECKDDAMYKVELSKDGGATYTTLSTDTTKTTYTAKLTSDGEYVFRISGVCGKEESKGVESEKVNVIVPLKSPVLAGESADQSITLNWEAVPQATHYEVYRKYVTEEQYKLLTTLSETTYTDVSIENEEPYYYYVIAKSETNESNPSKELLMLATAGREGKYVYEKEAAQIVITKKSYDTVYKNQATLEGAVDRAGEMALEVNGQIQETVSLNKYDTFSFKANLVEGRNDVNLLFTDKAGKVTRQTFNFVYLTNYDIIVDGTYTGKDGELATDGSGAKVYSTVQAAVDSVPSSNNERVVILIKEGNYKEYLRVASPYITLIGEDREKVNINFYDPDITIPGGSTAERCAIYIKPSATGFAAENLSFENTYEYKGDGSLSNESEDAVRVDADEATFVNVKLIGYQDTLQTNTNHQYFYKCYITGNVDFIYGTDSRTLLEDCDIVFRYNANKNSGYVTAPKTDIKYKYGYIFNNCRITAEEGCSGTKYLLARPWGADAAATFINTYMSDIINKTETYADMSGNSYRNARFKEYYSYGGGYAINGNRPQIAKAQAEEMLTTAYLEWDPYNTCKSVGSVDFVGNIITETEEKFIETEYENDKADPDATDDTGLGAFSLEGYAQKVTGGGVLLETASTYYKVDTADAFLNALTNIKASGKASVIELTADINLGSIEIGDALTKYSDIIKATSNQPLLHPTLLKTGVSTLYLKDMSNLTIYSKNGSALKHVCVDINNSSNIMIRNIVFDEIWEWDEATGGDYDRNDWDYITIQNGSTDIWIDHCTFYKAYDGIVDVKKADSSKPTNVTVSWSKFLPESESAFFDEMMDLLESNPEAYPYYNKLLTHYGMTKEQVRGYAAAQKKTHLVGASDTEANIQNLQLTLANNYYKNSMDRMPRLRGGNAHVYNCILDASDILKLRNSIENEEAKVKVVSNGAISTCDASVLLENTYIDGIINALASGNGSSPGGYINAVNSVYYMDGKLTELGLTDNAGAGMILDANKFTSNLPYKGYNLYNANELDEKVLPYTGAQAVDMSEIQWQKTTYNAPIINEDKEVTVTFNYDNATGNHEVATVKLVVGKAYGKLPQPTKAGYTFLGWYDEAGNKVTETTIINTAKDHTLLAKWGKISDSSSSSSSKGDGVITVTKPNHMTEENMPNNTTNNFKDISGHWAEESINYVVNKGILKGVSQDNFAPNTAMTRGMLVTALYRLANEPVVNTSNGFKDVKANTWYEAAINWAYGEGIVKGITQDKFMPNANVTREQMAVMLYNYIQMRGVSLNKVTEEVNFKDQENISAWAQEAMTFMAQTGIMQGDSKGNCNPKTQATRAEVSTMLYRLMEVLEAKQ